MSKRSFQPVISALVDSHRIDAPDGLQFKLSYGFEVGGIAPIFKIQVYENNQVKGTKSPSFSDSDWERIVSKQKALKKAFYNIDNQLRDNIHDLWLE